jgi:hypothetical protein
MSSHEQLDPTNLFDDSLDVQGQIYTDTDGIPGRRSIRAREMLKSVKDFKKEIRTNPQVREVVDNLHDQGFVVGAKAYASEIIFDVAKHKKAIIAGTAAAAGTIGAYHFFRRRNRQ